MPSNYERPIQSAEADSLGRLSFVKRLADSLIEPSTKKARGIVIGISGPWGSGKSSILNLLQEELQSEKTTDDYGKPIVVRFDPWLISGRNDLIAYFFNELEAKITEAGTNSPTIRQSTKKIIGKLTEYAAGLAPAVTMLGIPTLGADRALHFISQKVNAEKSLEKIRAELVDLIDGVGSPFVIFVDELDRVEDSEIRAVSQLIRAVADFPNISYVVAYDEKRVVEALSTGGNLESGRSYLEKIIQLQLQIPPVFSEELEALLSTELEKILDRYNAPENWRTWKRYEEYVEIVIPDLIVNLRDLKRLIQTFSAIEPMARGEVNWLDVLCYTTILCKAPGVAERIRSRADYLIDDPLNAKAQIRRYNDKLNPEERLGELNIPADLTNILTPLLKFLFPVLSDKSDVPTFPEFELEDSIRHRRPLRTLLHFGIPSGVLPRRELEVFLSDKYNVRANLASYQRDGKISAFLDRFYENYPALASSNDAEVWIGISEFVQKPDREWLQSYSDMPSIISSFRDSFERAATKSSEFSKYHAHILSKIATSEWDCNFSPLILRREIHANGLYRWAPRGNSVIPADTVDQLVKFQAKRDREAHLNGGLLNRLWTSYSIFNCLDAGEWNTECRDLTTALLSDTNATISMALLFFGGRNTTELETLDKILDLQVFINRAKLILAQQEIFEMGAEAALQALLESQKWHIRANKSPPT